MKFKYFLFVSIFLLILSMSVISATDLNESSSQTLNVSHEIPISKELDTNFNTNLNPGTFDDLQVEINNAANGSVLDLSRDYNGRYDYRIHLNKDLTIDGHGHTLNCLREKGCSAFYSNSGNIILKNLRIINGHNDYVEDGGAVRITGSAQYSIENCTFEDNWAKCNGGAIFNGADNLLTIKNCKFTSNKADDNGGAISSIGDVFIDNSTFNNNFADDYGGAVHCLNNAVLVDVYANKNVATVDGGVVYVIKNVNVTRCLFSFNGAERAKFYACTGGAIYSGNDVYVDNSTFYYNHADDFGGAIFAKGNVNINVNKHNGISYFEGNKALDDVGGAIYARGNVNVFNANFSKNCAHFNGGAIFSKNKVNVQHCLFEFNKASGAVLRCFGGAIRSIEVTVDNSTFESNFADNNGGAIYADSVNIVDTPSYFIGNSVEKGSGGAMYVNKFTNKVIKNLTCKDNFANSDGGAIYINKENSVSFNQCAFIHNEANDDGGAIYLDSRKSHLSLIGNIFEDNLAYREGDSVFNCGYYDKIEGNKWSVVPSSKNYQLIEWKAFKFNNHHWDSNPL